MADQVSAFQRQKLDKKRKMCRLQRLQGLPGQRLSQLAWWQELCPGLSPGKTSTGQRKNRPSLLKRFYYDGLQFYYPKDVFRTTFISEVESIWLKTTLPAYPSAAASPSPDSHPNWHKRSSRSHRLQMLIRVL